MQKILMMMVFIAFLFAGCGETIIQPGESALLYGTWNETENNEGVILLYKSAGFSECYGFTIRPDGSFTEHKNSGWCGTPPVLYGEYEGTWKKTGLNRIRINVGYWGGIEEYEMEYSFTATGNLSVKRLPS